MDELNLDLYLKAIPAPVAEKLISAAYKVYKGTSFKPPISMTIKEAMELLSVTPNLDPETEQIRHAAQSALKVYFTQDEFKKSAGHIVQDVGKFTSKNGTPVKRDPAGGEPEAGGADPANSNFDMDAWIENSERQAEEIEDTVQQIGKIVTEQQKIIRGVGEQMRHNVQDATHSLSIIQEQMQPIINEIISAFQKSALQNLDGIKEIRSAMGLYSEFFTDVIRQATEDYNRVLPYLKEEIKKPQYKGLTLDELLDGPTTDENGNATEEYLLLEQAIEAARAAAAAADTEKYPETTAKRADSIEYPLDKLNLKIWNFFEEDTNGQLRFAMESHAGKKKPLDLIYSIDFGALEETGVRVSKRLTPFDKRAYIAIAALFNTGNSSMSLTQIHYAMGNTTRPAQNQLERLNDSVTKMARAWVTVNDRQEHDAYRYDLDEHRADKTGWTGGVYEGPLLPIEKGKLIVNGRLADAAIHLFREPPMLTFAKLREQVTTIDVKLLQSPASKTDSNLQLEDYLIWRISRAKKGSSANKILLKTLYEHAGITTKKQKMRAPEKIKSYLEYYKSCGKIRSYSMNADSITFSF